MITPSLQRFQEFALTERQHEKQNQVVSTVYTGSPALDYNK